MSINAKARPAEGQLDNLRIARSLVKAHNIRFYDGNWHRFIGDRFVEVEATEIDGFIVQKLKTVIDSQNLTSGQTGNVLKVTRSMVNDTKMVLESLIGHLPKSRYGTAPFWINNGEARGEVFAMKNGLVARTQAIAGLAPSLHPHTADYFNQTVLPVEYDPSATAPRWEAFLNEVLESDPERIAIVQQLFGYCLIPGNDHHKFFMLEGSGANGKSVVLKVLSSLLGPANVSAVPLASFGERFALNSTVGRLVNLAPEADETDKPPVGVLKQFVAGDVLTIDRKFNTPVTVAATAKLVIAANSRPRFLDTSDGLWRRLIAIPFRVTIKEENQDKLLVQKLERELSGIFNWALKGLHRLQTQGMFTTSKIVDEAGASYKLDMNPAHQFLLDSGYRVAGGDDAFVFLPSVFDSYKAWCEQFGYFHKNFRNFGKEFTTLFPESATVQKTIHGKRERVRTGVTNKPVVESKEEQQLAVAS